MSDSENSYESPLNILKKHSVKVDEKFVIQLTKSSKVLCRDVKESCKVIHLSVEWNFEEVLKTLDGLSPKEYPNLFIFTIEASNFGFKSNDQNKSQEEIEKLSKCLLKFSDNHPMILQLTSQSEDETKFYYKEESSTKLIIIGNNHTNFESCKNFPSFLCSFLDGKFENFDDKIIEKITNSQNCSLILRFLRALNLSENIFEKIILEISKNGSKNEFLSALDASLEDHGRILNYHAQDFISEAFVDSKLSNDSTSDQDDQNSSNDEKLNFSVLLTAVENKNKEVIDYLVTYWTHLIQQLPFVHRVKISTTALETNQLDVLCDLLEIVDFPFPENFKADLINHERLRYIVNFREEFKEAIENESFDKIDDFIDKNLSLKSVFNLENISAMNQAVDSRKFKAYFYLKSFGFQTTSDIDLEEILTEEELENAETQAIKQRRKNVKEALRDVDNPVMLLATRSFIHNRRTSKKKEAEYRLKIKKWLGDIHKIKFGPELLNTAASCENLKITFDFESIMV